MLGAQELHKFLTPFWNNHEPHAHHVRLILPVLVGRPRVEVPRVLPIDLEGQIWLELTGGLPILCSLKTTL